jgi:poly(hydroxyalkanoate) depolymerase family esterase
MNARQKSDMMEATRLTREGRLREAMAVLGAVFRGAPAAGTGHDPMGGESPPRHTAPAPSALARPSSTPTGQPQTPSHASGRLDGAREGAGAPASPRPLRALFDRLPQRGPLQGLDGLGLDGLGLDGLIGRRAPHIPPTLPDGARFEERFFANEAGRRAYKLYVPSGYSGQALPLVVMLHGCTQSPDDFAAGTRMNEVAEEQTFLVAYPAQDHSANTSRCWNWFNPHDQKRDRGEPSLIAGITRQIMQDFPVDSRRVYIAGLSAGGAAAAVMGATYPDLYGAIGVHSGLACGAAHDVPSAFAAMRQGGLPAGAERRRQGGAVRTIVFHGDGDKTVNPINADHVIVQSKPAADLQTSVGHGEAPGGIRYTRTVQVNGTGQPILEQWVLHGAGHAWSGGSADGSYTEPRGPDASREMVRFFFSDPTSPSSSS